MRSRAPVSLRRLVELARSSPWPVIALVPPVLVWAVMSVVFLQDERRSELPAGTLSAVAPAPVVPGELLGKPEPNRRETPESIVTELVPMEQRVALVAPARESARQHLVAVYDQARRDYQDAQLLRAGSPEHTRLLESALEGFQDVSLDAPDSLENYVGIIYQGLCHDALGLPDDALVDYEDAVALREQFVVDPEGVYLVGPREGDVVSGATLQRVKLLTRLKRTREAVAAAQDFLATIPDALLTSSGPEILEAQFQAESVGASSTAQDRAR